MLASSDRIVGAEYQTLILLRGDEFTERAGSLPRASPTSTSVARLRHATKRSNTERSK